MAPKSPVIFVTGGASGLGEATVEHFLDRGHNVAFCDLNREAGEALATKRGANALFINGDISSEPDIVRAMNEVRTKFGRLDICVNCAGIFAPEPVLMPDNPKTVHRLESFVKTINVNVIGTFNVCRLAAQLMAVNEPDSDGLRGLIVNVSSVAAEEPWPKSVAYGTSKAAVSGMTLHLAKDLSAFGIRVMTIAPGLFDTPLLRSQSNHAEAVVGQMCLGPKRSGKPAEFARFVQAIVDNPLLNGGVIRLDAGTRVGHFTFTGGAIMDVLKSVFKN